MKKIIEYIKDFYHEDLEGIIASIFIAIFAYVLLWHVFPIILGL